MINKSLTYIKEYLSTRIGQLNPADGWTVELGAVKKEEHTAGRDIVITLVHIEEERDAKSIKYYRKVETGGVILMSPEIKLNLYILISSQKEQYETALKQISRIIGIFQAKNTFDGDEINKEGIGSLALDLYPLTLEQNNSLWQTLGATMMPSVMYKVRTVVVQESMDNVTGSSIREGGVEIIITQEQPSPKEQEEHINEV